MKREREGEKVVGNVVPLTIYLTLVKIGEKPVREQVHPLCLYIKYTVRFRYAATIDLSLQA